MVSEKSETVPLLEKVRVGAGAAVGGDKSESFVIDLQRQEMKWEPLVCLSVCCIIMGEGCSGYFS
jgi:hypothetical protein